MSPVYNETGRLCGMTEAVWRETSRHLWRLMVCSQCHKPLLVLNDFQRHFPYSVVKESNPKLPGNIHKELDEARRCLEIKCYDACMYLITRLLRRYLQAKSPAAADSDREGLVAMCQAGMITQRMVESICRVLAYGTPKTDRATSEMVHENYHSTHEFFMMLYGQD